MLSDLKILRPSRLTRRQLCGSNVDRNEIWRLMEQEEGIRRDDPSTWPVKCPIAKIFGPDQGEVRSPSVVFSFDRSC
eukprot:44882-Eustigmatos_ZCMA.PRE.1